MFAFYRSALRVGFADLQDRFGRVQTWVLIVGLFVSILNKPIGASLVNQDWSGFSPLWPVCGIALLFVYLLLRGNYSRFALLERSVADSKTRAEERRAAEKLERVISRHLDIGKVIDVSAQRLDAYKIDTNFLEDPIGSCAISALSWIQSVVRSLSYLDEEWERHFGKSEEPTLTHFINAGRGYDRDRHLHARLLIVLQLRCSKLSLLKEQVARSLSRSI